MKDTEILTLKIITFMMTRMIETEEIFLESLMLSSGIGRTLSLVLNPKPVVVCVVVDIIPYFSQLSINRRAPREKKSRYFVWKVAS